MNDDIPIEEWFWEIIERCKPEKVRLERELMETDRTTVEKFIVYYYVASWQVCEPWDGPFIDDSVGHLSEDSTEDLADWVVAQGRDAWHYAQTTYVDWRRLLYLAHDPNAERSSEIEMWHLVHTANTESGWGAAKGVAKCVFHDRFGVSFADVKEELFAKYDPSIGT